MGDEGIAVDQKYEWSFERKYNGVRSDLWGRIIKLFLMRG